MSLLLYELTYFILQEYYHRKVININITHAHARTYIQDKHTNIHKSKAQEIGQTKNIEKSNGLNKISGTINKFL